MNDDEPVDGEDRGPIARRLNELIEFAQERDGHIWTIADIADASDVCGLPVSKSVVSHIRTGRIRTPSFRVIEGIAAALGVDVGEFSIAADPAVQELRSAQDEARAARLELWEAMRVVGAAGVAHRGARSSATRTAAAAREQASMMRALARALLDDQDDEDEAD